jgi:hypothetical protein
VLVALAFSAHREVSKIPLSIEPMKPNRAIGQLCSVYEQLGHKISSFAYDNVELIHRRHNKLTPTPNFSIIWTRERDEDAFVAC